MGSVLSSTLIVLVVICMRGYTSDVFKRYFFVFFFIVFFFCQAEDGIRDLVRSRGLGDVYKRQLFDDRALVQVGRDVVCRGANDLDTAVMRLVVGLGTLEAVSYTHLTLPTSDLV